MGVNSLPKTVTRQGRDCDLNPGPSAPESSTLTTRLPSHPQHREQREIDLRKLEEDGRERGIMTGWRSNQQMGWACNRFAGGLAARPRTLAMDEAGN